MQPLPPRPFTPFDYALPAGRGIHAMISPLPRCKRAKAPAPGEPKASGFQNSPFAQLEINR